MNVYRIAVHVLDSKYHGSGYALVAIDAGEVVDLVYLDDALPEFGDALDAAEESGQREKESALRQAISDDRLRPVIEKLRAQGNVSIGMCSSTEFVEL